MNLELIKNSSRYSNEEGNEFLELSVMCKEIPSVNSMYSINYKTKHKFDSPITTMFRQEVTKQIKELNPSVNCPWIKSDGSYCIYYEVLFNHSYNKRDLDNTLKCIQDVFCRSLGKYDDNRVHEIHAYKGYINSDFEVVRIRLTKSDYDHLKYNK